MIPARVEHFLAHLEAAIHQHVPNGPEKKLALDHLDEAAEWVNTAITKPPREGMYT